MVRIKAGEMEYTGNIAVKGDDYVSIFDENGVAIATLGIVSSFDEFELLEGEWSGPPQTLEDRIKELEAIILKLGGSV